MIPVAGIPKATGTPSRDEIKDSCTFSLDLIKQVITLASAGIAFILGLVGSSTGKMPFLIVLVAFLLLTVSILTGWYAYARMTALVFRGKYAIAEPIFRIAGVLQVLFFVAGFCVLGGSALSVLCKKQSTVDPDPMQVVAQSTSNLCARVDLLLTAQSTLNNAFFSANTNSVAIREDHVRQITSLIGKIDSLAVAQANLTDALKTQCSNQSGRANPEALRHANDQIAAIEALKKPLQSISDQLRTATNTSASLENISREIASVRVEVTKLQPMPPGPKKPNWFQRCISWFGK